RKEPEPLGAHPGAGSPLRRGVRGLHRVLRAGASRARSRDRSGPPGSLNRRHLAKAPRSGPRGRYRSFDEPMRRLGLQRDLVDAGVYDRTVARFREERILLPTFAQLADPTKVPDKVVASLGSVGPDDAHPLNLFRVHWYNG